MHRHSIKMRRVAAVVVLALISLLAFAPAANADERKFEVEFSFDNPCTNETIDFRGTVLGFLNVSPGHLLFHAGNLNVTGVGETSGTRYREIFTFTEVHQGSDESGPFAETSSFHWRIVTPGPGNDFVSTIVFHMTINANGEVVVQLNRLNEGTCV
jgi:hypothetical protein